MLIIYWFDSLIFKLWGVGTPTDKTDKLWQSRWWDDGEGNKWKSHPARSSPRRSSRKGGGFHYNTACPYWFPPRLFTVTKKVRFWCLTDGQHVIVEISCNKLARSTSSCLRTLNLWFCWISRDITAQGTGEVEHDVLSFPAGVGNLSVQHGIPANHFDLGVWRWF